MKVLVSRRSRLARLDLGLVLCCTLIVVCSRECGARIITQDGSDTKVEEVHADSLKPSLEEVSSINEELKSVGNVDGINEKKLRHVTETNDKNDKEIEHSSLDDASASREVENGKTIENEKIVKKQITDDQENAKIEDYKGLKTITKRAVKRLKRADQETSEEKLPIDKTIGKSVEDKQSEPNDYVGQNKRVDIEGIRRLDIDIEEEDKKENRDASKINLETIALQNIEDSDKINSNINQKAQNINVKNIDLGRSEETNLKLIGKKSNDELSKKATIAKISIIDDKSIIKETDMKNEGISKIVQDEPDSNENITPVLPSISSRAETFPRIQLLKDQALEFQKKIRNITFLNNLKEKMSDILPDIPKFTEKQFLEILKSIANKKKIQESNDFNYDIYKNPDLSENQIDILKCTQPLVAQQERQSFYDNMSQCIRGLSVINCMRIFIYPIIVENMPEAVLQYLPSFPIEINVADIFQGAEKQKTARQLPIFSFYSNAVDPDVILYDNLKQGLQNYPQYKDLPSYIDTKNESLSKLLTCNKLQLLYMTEKFLPAEKREGYSSEMLSCLTRFEYYSCIKYFSWPTIKKYYPALPQFPLSDSYLSSLVYPNYPLITYPGFESGFSNLPEVIESGAARRTPEAVINSLLKKALTEYPRMATLPTPIQLDLMAKSNSITQDQIASIHLAEQLLPINLRAEYVSKTTKCIAQFDYYNCFKYASWPVLRQANPTLPEFPNFQEILGNIPIPQIPQIPQISNLFDYFSQFQLPIIQFPQFQLPEIPTFSLPDFSSFFPIGQQIVTTSKPQVDSPPAQMPTATDQTSTNNRFDAALEFQIYKILKNVRDIMGATPLSPATYTNRKVFLFPLMTEDQTKIFALAEGILPPVAREPLITSMFFCLNDKNLFSTCAKTIMWPSIRNYVKGLPEFPTASNFLSMQDKLNINSYPSIVPEREDNYFIMREIEKIFFEGREDAMSYIIRSIQISTPESFNMQKIFELLQSIRLNDPNYLNAQSIRYARRPELASILTESQENIVHAVESILPESLRLKFYNDILECAQKNKFIICSRNIIFPAIYPYFQRALFVPYYNLVPQKQNFTQALNLNKILQDNIEAKIDTVKPRENLETVSEKRFVPIYPSNPESIVFSMLRKVQICSRSLPQFPTKSIAYTPEFKQAFSVRQVHILAVAEGILPKEYRTGLLEEMYKCNNVQKDSFLNCTRDILFPIMMKAYPDFPEFPDFENDLNQSAMLSVIDSLNKSSISPRSYNSKRTLPTMEVLYQFVPDNKIDGLRVLIDGLPNILYYDLYIKMAQCTQYSDSISCGHDIIYPTLKKYYDAPRFNVDDYYPITTQPPLYSPLTNQRAPFDYEIFCENMGFSCTLLPFGSRYAPAFLNSPISPTNVETSYIPFGRLSDGSRIFKQIQDIWNTNITPSVGEHCSLQT